jgi:hypothetical protein
MGGDTHPLAEIAKTAINKILGTAVRAAPSVGMN